MADLTKSFGEAIEAMEIEIKEQIVENVNIQTREVLVEKMCTILVYFDGITEKRYLRYEIAKKASILKRRKDKVWRTMAV